MGATKPSASAAHKDYVYGGNASSPISRAVQLPEAMKLPSGIWIANCSSRSPSSGIAISTSLAGCYVFERASIAANFTG